MDRLKKIINYLSLEEFLNAITHGIGAVLAVVGFVALIIEAYLNGGKWHLVSFLIYGISLILLYVASTLYHSFKNEKIKGYLKIFDHSAIYLLIAGNYTPFVLVPLHGVLGWSIFGIVWGMALIGIVFKLFFAKRFKFISTICYLIMGWFAVVMIKPLLASLPIGAIYWLLVGGVFYTIGSVFYLMKRIPYNHVIWHLFVLAGSSAHFVAVLGYLTNIKVN